MERALRFFADATQKTAEDGDERRNRDQPTGSVYIIKHIMNMHIERLRWMRFRWILPPRFPWPNGPWSLAQGFNPGNRHPERRALKGRQIERASNVEVESNCSTSQLRTLTLTLQ